MAVQSFLPSLVQSILIPPPNKFLQGLFLGPGLITRKAQGEVEIKWSHLTSAVLKQWLGAHIFGEGAKSRVIISNSCSHECVLNLVYLGLSTSKNGLTRAQMHKCMKNDGKAWNYLATLNSFLFCMYSMLVTTIPD